MTAIRRVMLLSAIVACGLALACEPAAAQWRRGWGPYPYGWGWAWPQYYDDGPFGPGWYNPYTTYYVPPPPQPDPAYRRLWSKCPKGRVPARWTKRTDKHGRVVMIHQMGRCR